MNIEINTKTKQLILKEDIKADELLSLMISLSIDGTWTIVTPKQQLEVHPKVQYTSPDNSGLYQLYNSYMQTYIPNECRTRA